MTTRGTSELKNKLAQRANGAMQRPEKPEDTIRKLLERMAPEIKRALPKHMDVDRLTRVALTTIRLNPKLLECNATSLIAAVMQAAQLGLEPGILGHCYIVPYGKEATFVIGYRGMIDLARRSGNIESIYAHVVYANDYFRLRYGLEEELVHIPWHLREDQKFEDGGAIKGAYMVAKFKDGGHYFHYMPVAEIEKHRQRSKAANNGPWVTDYEEMAKKTVVRSAWKWLPISVEIARKVESSDETVKREIAEDMTEVPNAIDVQAQFLDEEPTQPEADSDRQEPAQEHGSKGEGNDAPTSLFES